MIFPLLISFPLLHLALSSPHYAGRCTRISNDLPHLGGKILRYRLDLCADARESACTVLVESEEYSVSTNEKLFSSNLWFQFNRAQIDEALRERAWNPKSARVAYGYVIDGQFRSTGNSALETFLADAERSQEFGSGTRFDARSGMIDENRCEIVHVTREPVFPAAKRAPGPVLAPPPGSAAAPPEA